jgi:F0F1-type ATP synthase membrane subunit a
MVIDLSMLSPTVRSSKPTFHLWHRPKCKLQKSHGLVFSSCHVHFKCLTENSLWMTDKLDWMLKNSIGLNKVRTIYGSDNQSALIPTTERCSLNYLLQSNSSIWRETYDYMRFKIRKFIVRRTVQIALIHVMERFPLSLQINAQDEEFQWTDGHSFFLYRRTGWLYFRNVRGDWNAWERSRDHRSFISSKMRRKLNKKESTMKIAVFSFLSHDLVLRLGSDTRRCAFLRVAGNKKTRLCTKQVIMAEIAADVLNFTTVYTYDLVNRSGYPAGSIAEVPGSKLYLDKSLPESFFMGSFSLVYERYHTFVYCNYNIRSRSMSIAVWFFPYDFSSWIIVVVIHCLFLLVQVKRSDSPNALQVTCDSLLNIFQILFRQPLYKPKWLSMLFIFSFLIFSFFYENLISSSLIAQLQDTPFKNKRDAINAGYVYEQNITSLIRARVFFVQKQTENLISFINEFFPDNKKVIYPYASSTHHTIFWRIFNAIKVPYKCPFTRDRVGTFRSFAGFCNCIKTQLADVYEWIHETGLFNPFLQLQYGLFDFGIRAIELSLSSKSKFASNLEGNLVTLRNLVPLFITGALACIVSSLIFLLECKRPSWKLYFSHKLQLISRNSVNPIIQVESNP